VVWILLYLDLSHEERVAHAVEFIFFSLPRFVKGLHQLFFSHLSFLEHLCVAFSALAVVCPAFAFLLLYLLTRLCRGWVGFSRFGILVHIFHFET
jgi:hypothetical protein